MSLSIVNSQRAVKLDRVAVRALVKSLLVEHGAAGADLSITFADDAHVRELNRDYRGIDKPTDVLAFAMRDGGDHRAEGEELVLGDVVVSVDRAAVQARRFKRTVDREILKLVAHGVLHLLGYDHPNEKRLGDMRRVENRHVRAVVDGA
jgi:probable rRNA maturation factor